MNGSIIHLLYKLYKTFWGCIGVVTRWDRRDYNDKIEYLSDHGYILCITQNVLESIDALNLLMYRVYISYAVYKTFWNFGVAMRQDCHDYNG